MAQVLKGRQAAAQGFSLRLSGPQSDVKQIQETRSAPECAAWPQGTPSLPPTPPPLPGGGTSSASSRRARRRHSRTRTSSATSKVEEHGLPGRSRGVENSPSTWSRPWAWCWRAGEMPGCLRVLNVALSRCTVLSQLSVYADTRAPSSGSGRAERTILTNARGFSVSRWAWAAAIGCGLRLPVVAPASVARGALAPVVGRGVGGWAADRWVWPVSSCGGPASRPRPGSGCRSGCSCSRRPT